MKQIKVVELFAGTRSIGKEAQKLGMEVFSSDLHAEFETDYTVDILNFDISRVPFRPNIVWASPPCNKFSVMTFQLNWIYRNGTIIPKNKEARKALRIVKRTLSLIKALNPDVWYIENPRAALRKMPMMRRLPVRNTVAYCQYGDIRQKPTDIWTNNNLWQPVPMCLPGSSCHESAPRGSQEGGTRGLSNAELRSKIPEKLCKEILVSGREFLSRPKS